jgi:DNA-binding PucR family transcriptional regulator
MARLHELFGAALDDPDQRFELDLAMRLALYAPPAEAS